MRARILLVALSALAWTGADAADPQRGADSYDANCAECHSLAHSLKNKKGPGLFGIVGQRAAAVPGFEYSEALKASGITWTPDRLDAYIADPRKLVPGGGRMKFDGVTDPAERADLIAFMAQQK